MKRLLVIIILLFNISLLYPDCFDYKILINVSNHHYKMIQNRFWAYVVKQNSVPQMILSPTKFQELKRLILNKKWNQIYKVFGFKHNVFSRNQLISIYIMYRKSEELYKKYAINCKMTNVKQIYNDNDIYECEGLFKCDYFEDLVSWKIIPDYKNRFYRVKIKSLNYYKIDIKENN